MKRTAAVIATHNRKEKLQNCIRAVLGQEPGYVPDIIVIDNNSEDGTADLFRKHTAAETIAAYGAPCSGGRIFYFNTGLNSGGAGAFCFGLRKAAELGYELAWLMDDDTVPSETALKVLLEYDDKLGTGYGFLSCKVLWTDGSLCRMNVQRETVTKNVKDFSRPVIGIEMASFVSLLIPLKVVRDVGLPYRKFYIWTDDWEYTRRISFRYPCYLITGSVVIHDMEENIKADIAYDSGDRIERYRYLYRNDVFLYRREGLRGLGYEMLRIPAHLARIAVSNHGLAEKKKRAGIVIKGTVSGLSFFPEPERLNPDV